MIKLNRTNPPAKLTPEFVSDKTEHFKATKESVWDYDWLKNSLMALSNDKCAYCECQLGLEDSYMEVEHFRDKSDFPDLVLDWENLFPSCKRCNGNKSDHNVEDEPIINPFVDNPPEHMFFFNYFYKPYDKIGWNTIDILNLNENPRVIKARTKVASTFITSLEKALNSLSGLNTKRKWNNFLNSFSGIMDQCLPESQYAALCATLFIEDPNSSFIIDKLKEKGIWRDIEESKLSTIKGIAMNKNASKAIYFPT